MTLRSWTGFDTCFLMLRYGVRLTQQRAYWAKQNFLTQVPHLSKLQDIQNSFQTCHLIDQILLNLPSKTD